MQIMFHINKYKHVFESDNTHALNSLNSVDVKKQSQMSQLSKQRDNLQKVINTYHSLFDTTDLLTKELQSKTPYPPHPTCQSKS